MKKIYLSFPALVCCAGLNANELYESCLSGNQSGFVTRKFDNRDFSAGQIKNDLPKVDLQGFALPSYAGDTRIIRIINMAVSQLSSYIKKAITKYGREKVGICLGSCDNGSEASNMAHKAFLENGSFPKDYNLHFQSASFPAEFIAAMFGIKGPVITAATACASGASAIIRGAELIKSGICDAVIAGGADIVSQTVFTGFNVLEAVSDKLSNPFSKNRKGINLGEAAAFFLLESEQISDIELLGTGESSDAYHMTAPGEDGEGPVKAMRAALKDAGVSSGKIDYINLHGTGTVLNDKAESFALRTVFNSSMPPASSTKPVTGHTMGAAGALEAAICWMVLNERRGLPVHCWDGEADEGAPVFLVPLSSQTGNVNPVLKTPSICMTNNFAFGGCNVSLIIGRKNDRI